MAAINMQISGHRNYLVYIEKLDTKNFYCTTFLLVIVLVKYTINARKIVPASIKKGAF